MSVVIAFPIPHDRREAVDRPRLLPVPDGCRRRRPAARALPAGTYVRRRFAALLLLALAGVVVVAAVRTVPDLVGAPPPVPAGSARVATTPLAPVTVATRSYVVRPGDTLWSIARRLEPDGDVRITVQRLARVNGGSALQVGQRLVLDR